MRRAGWGALLLLGANLLLGACATAPAPLVCASDLDHPPFAGVDESGNPFGYEVVLMEELAAELGRPLVWRRMEFSGLIDAAIAGEVDVVCATLGVSPARAEVVRFSTPYLRTAIGLVTLAGLDAAGPDGLRGRRVAYSAGTTSEDAVLRSLPDAIHVPLGKGESPVAVLFDGRAHAVAVDGPDASILAHEPGIARLPFDLGAEDYALVLPPGAHALQRDVDEVLERFEAEGRLAELWAEFFETP